MIRHKLALALLFSMLLPVPSSANSTKVLNQWNGDKIAWQNFQNGTRLARENGRSIMVVFHATWCPHCARYRQQFFDSRVIAKAEELVMVLVDTDRSPAIDSRYGQFGSYVPRTMILSPNGKLISNIRGSNRRYRYFLNTHSPKELLRVMRKAVAR